MLRRALFQGGLGVAGSLLLPDPGIRAVDKPKFENFRAFLAMVQVDMGEAWTEQFVIELVDYVYIVRANGERG